MVAHSAIDHSGLTFVGCKIYNSAAQTMNGSGTNAGNTLITFNSEEFDYSTPFHDTGSNTSRITIPTGFGGKYLVGYSIWATSGAPSAGTIIDIFKNGATPTTYHGARSVSEVASIQTEWSMTTLIALAQADYIELNLNNPNASTFTIGHATAQVVQSAFWAWRIGA